MQTIDLDLIRSFVAFHETGSLAGAADRVGRTESAVSLQMKRLEDIVNQRVMERLGRRLVLREEGYGVLHYARQMLAMNDDLLSTVSSASNFGVSAGRCLAGFRRRNPSLYSRTWQRPIPVFVLKWKWRVVCAVGVRSRKRRLMLCLRSAFRIIRRRTLCNVQNSPGLRARNRRSRSKNRCHLWCSIRHADLSSAQWRLLIRRDPLGNSVPEPRLTGLWAATRANLGMTVRSSYWVPTGLQVLEARRVGLPDLADTEVNIH